MKRIIIIIAILLIPIAVMAEKDIPVVAVSCFRITDNTPVCQIKQKTYNVDEFLQEISKLGKHNGNQSRIRFSIALDFPSGDLLTILSEVQSAGFTDIEVTIPNSLPSQLVEQMPREKVGFKLLMSPKKNN